MSIIIGSSLELRFKRFRAKLVYQEKTVDRPGRLHESRVSSTMLTSCVNIESCLIRLQK
jgi:hypothetical protein